MSLGLVAAMAGAGVGAGALVELYSVKVDDNLTIPWAAAGASALVAMFLT